MTKFVRSIVLAAAIAGLVSAAGMSVAPAQDKKKVDEKKTTTKKTEVSGSVEVYKDKAGEYRFKIVGEEGKALAMTTKGYEKKEDAIKALDMVKAILNTAKVTELKDDKK
ncbi:MAG TPA: DUF1508 domain-containing protein [Gemmataceae bacterium]|nr:DUF1508 domain-containing protein [Gemmataceae bacterium]